MRVKLCSRHQVSSAGFILGSIDRWSESLWLWKGAGEEQVQEETLFDAGAEGMTWNGKRRHSGIYGIELWVVAHEKQVKDNTVCCRGMHFQPRWDEFRVISHHIYIYIHTSVDSAERESRAEFLVVQEMGEGCTGMFQRPSQMWLMLSSLERTHSPAHSGIHSVCVCVCVDITHHSTAGLSC